MHPVVPKAAALQAAPVKLYRQRSRGVIGGTCTRFGEGHGLEPRLLRHRPQSAWSESNTPLSLIGQRHDPRATGGKTPCLMARIERAAVTPHGWHVASESNAASPDLESRPLPRGRRKKISTTGRIRTFTSNLRSVVSRPQNGGIWSGRLELHQRPRACLARTLLLSYIRKNESSGRQESNLPGHAPKARAFPVGHTPYLVEPSLGIAPSPVAYQATVPFCGSLRGRLVE